MKMNIKIHKHLNKILKNRPRAAMGAFFLAIRLVFTVVEVYLQLFEQNQ